MSVITVGVMELAILLSVLGVGAPLGMPPLPEDPYLAAVAPEPCLFYFSSAGTASPDPASQNQTEQLIAEPEVQRLLTEIERQIITAVRHEAGHDEPERTLAEHAK